MSRNPKERRRARVPEAAEASSRPSASGPSGTGPSGTQRGTDLPVLSKWTGLYGGAGLVVAVLGFLLLGQGSIVAAPVLLVLAFLVLFPIALLK